MLIDDGLLRFEDGAWRSRRGPGERDRAADDPPAAGRAARPARRRGARGDRARLRGGQGVPLGRRRRRSARRRPARTCRSRLLALARKELIRPDRAEFAGEDAFRFRHLLIRDAAYQAMPKEQRAELHERFADWLDGGRAASGWPSTRRSSRTTSSRRTGTGRSSAPRTSRARESRRRAAEHLYASAVRADERGDLIAARGVPRADRTSSRTTRLRANALLLLAEVLHEVGEYTARVRDVAARARGVADAVGGSPRWRCGRSCTGSSTTARSTRRTRSRRRSEEAQAVLDEAEALGDDVTSRDRAVLGLALLVVLPGEDRRDDRAARPGRSRGRRRCRRRIALRSRRSCRLRRISGRSRSTRRSRSWSGRRRFAERQPERARRSRSGSPAALLGMAGRFEEAHEACSTRGHALRGARRRPMAVVATNQGAGGDAPARGRVWRRRRRCSGRCTRRTTRSVRPASTRRSARCSRSRSATWGGTRRRSEFVATEPGDVRRGRLRLAGRVADGAGAGAGRPRRVRRCAPRCRRGDRDQRTRPTTSAGRGSATR